MSWTRLDDLWSRKRLAEGLTFEENGYLVALIQECSSTDRFDGRIKAFTARTMGECSDVDTILAHIVDAGHARWEDGYLILTSIGDYVPSEEVRDRTATEREKKRRQRAHARGDHSLCSHPESPSDVPGTVPGTREPEASTSPNCPPDVPGTVGTGQGGPGLRRTTPTPRASVPSQAGPPPFPPGVVDLLTGEVDVCADCDEALTWCKCGTRVNDPT